VPRTPETEILEGASPLESGGFSVLSENSKPLEP